MAVRPAERNGPRRRHRVRGMRAVDAAHGPDHRRRGDEERQRRQRLERPAEEQVAAARGRLGGDRPVGARAGAATSQETERGDAASDGERAEPERGRGIAGIVARSAPDGALDRAPRVPRQRPGIMVGPARSEAGCPGCLISTGGAPRSGARASHPRGRSMSSTPGSGPVGVRSQRSSSRSLLVGLLRRDRRSASTRPALRSWRELLPAGRGDHQGAADPRALRRRLRHRRRDLLRGRGPDPLDGPALPAQPGDDELPAADPRQHAGRGRSGRSSRRSSSRSCSSSRGRP